MKNWLRAQPRQPATLAELQTLLDTFAAVYNTRRPHHSLEGRATPAAAYAARPKAVPGDRADDTHDRVRTDRVDATGLVTLRHSGKLLHIGIGRPHAGTRVLMLVQDLRVRVINAATGELIRELVLDPARPTSPPASHPAGQRKHRGPYAGSRCPRCLETSHVWQVLGSNQRKLSRWFYRPPPYTRSPATMPRVSYLRHIFARRSG